MTSKKNRGGKRTGAGNKYDPEAWEEGGAGLHAKGGLPFLVTIESLKQIIRGNPKNAKAALKPFMSREKIKRSIELLEGVVRGTNREMWEACVEVAGMFSELRVGQEAHRVIAGVPKMAHGKFAATNERDMEIRRVRQRTNQASRNTPPREVRKEWLEKNVAEMIRLMKEKDPDAPVGQALEPIDPDLWLPPMVVWPKQPLRDLCVDATCEFANREHLHCRECRAVMRMDVAPGPGVTIGEDLMGICEKCYWKAVHRRGKIEDT